MDFRIKILGATPIESKLDDTQDYSIVLKRCSIKSVNRNSNSDDGEYVYTYSLESLDEVTIIGAGNKIIKGQGKSRSKQMRARLYQIALDRGLEPEEFYQKSMNKLISEAENII